MERALLKITFTILLIGSLPRAYYIVTAMF